MTNIKANILNKLRSLAITAVVWEGDLPQNPTYPTTVFDLIDEVPVGRSHDSDVSPFRDARVQIDVYAETRAQADDLIELYYVALNSFDGLVGDGASPETSVDMVIRYESTNPNLNFQAESTTRVIKGRSMDFKIFYK
jgi:hypothetical protein